MAIEIQRATSEDENLVFEFLVKNFFPSEPMSASINRMPDCKENCRAIKYLSQNLSFKVVKKDFPHEILAVAINREEDLLDNGSDMRDYIERYRDNPYGQGFLFLHWNEEKFHKKARLLWPGAKTSFDVDILCVSEEYRRQNLARQLLQRSMDLAKKLNYNLVTIKCTSAFTSKLCEKEGFQKVDETRYEDWKDENGEIIFKTEDPHKFLTNYCKAL